MTDIIGKRIVDVRPMTDQELADEYWEGFEHLEPPVVVLDDGTILYPSRDAEGNGPGSLFGKESDGFDFQLAVIRKSVLVEEPTND